jgi:hypothetical protein
MRPRALVLLIALYVSLDLCNPFMPGAFRFDAEESVEGAHAQRGRLEAVGLGGLPATRIAAETREEPPPPAPARAARRRFEAPRPFNGTPSEPPPPGEDH